MARTRQPLRTHEGATVKMLQPRKDVLREQLVLAADEIIRLREQREMLFYHAVELTERRWWHRLMWWRK